MTKIVASTMPGTANRISTPCDFSHGPSTDPAPKQEHVDQARDDRRDRERQVDQRRQEGLALELELGDRPGCRHAEDEIERHGDGCHGQRQAHGGQRVGLAEREQEFARALAERLDEDGDQRQHKEQRQEAERHRNEDALGDRTFRGRASVAARACRARRNRLRHVSHEFKRHSHTSCGSRPGSG